MNKKLIAAIVIIALTATTSVYALIKKDIIDLPGVNFSNTPSNYDNITQANNQFAIDYYKVLKDKDKNNIFFSPISITSALGMVYEGAEGETASEIAQVIHTPLDDQTRLTEYRALIEELNKDNDDYELEMANALWLKDGFKVSNTFLDTLDEYYKSKPTSLDFAGDSNGSAKVINKWVDDKTRGKIHEIVTPDYFNEYTRLILTNAIYFKGTWETEFPEKNTRKEDFTLNNGDKVKVDLMSRTDKDSEYKYFEDKTVQALEMPYSGDNLSMLILLPKDKNLDMFEDKISSSKIEEYRKESSVERVDIYIPKFTFRTEYDMGGDLSEMGMPTAFSKYADFSRITTDEKLHINRVLHKTFVEVNESGTEAAAVTMVGIVKTTSVRDSEPPIPVFRADHPFIFIIQQKDSGNILFMGRVNDPTK